MQKTVLVTGASKGIGRATALALCAEGVVVHGTYCSGADAARELEREHELLKFHQVDFSDRQSTYRLLDELQGIQLDGVVNNAGLFIPDVKVEDPFAMEAWDRSIEVNLTSAMLLATGLRHQFRPGSAIVNVSSLSGIQGELTSVSYAASKAALISLTASLGNVLGAAGTRVNAVAPGWVNTEMATKWASMAAQVTPLARNAEPEEISDLVCYLLSEKSRFINGETIVIDGGYSHVDYVMLREDAAAEPDA